MRPRYLTPPISTLDVLDSGEITRFHFVSAVCCGSLLVSDVMSLYRGQVFILQLCPAIDFEVSASLNVDFQEQSRFYAWGIGN